MEVHSLKKIHFFGKQTAFLLATFFGVRLISFFLAGHSFLQGVLVFFILMTFAGIYFRNQEVAWYILIGELLLGGSGHLLEIANLSLRSALLMTFLFLWIIHLIYDHRRAKEHLSVPHPLLTSMILFVIVAIYGGVLGIVTGNGLFATFSDLIPYLYIPLVIPAYHIYKMHRNHERLAYLLIAFTLGTALWSGILFFLFSSNLAFLHAPFYSWITTVEGGQITPLVGDFFRIVFPSHMMVPGVTLIAASLLMRKTRRRWWLWIILGSSLLTLSLNFSRTYLLALLVGFLVLLYRHEKDRWLQVSLASAGIFFTLLLSAAFLTSTSQSTGFDVLELRGKSFVDPTVEESTATRVTMLEPIFNHIGNHPLRGNGLGETITYQHPTTQQRVTSHKFYWGFLELWVEFGILGLLVVIWMLGSVMHHLLLHIRARYHEPNLDVGLLASMAALIIITMFEPGISHVFGMLMLLGTLAVLIQPVPAREHLLSYLYHLVHKHESED